ALRITHYALRPMARAGKRIPKWLDRAGFEADKLMRLNRVRAEVTRITHQTEEKTQSLATKVLELAEAGKELDPELRAIVDEIKTLQAQAGKKEGEIKAISAEVWVEPAPPGPPPPPPDLVAKRLEAYVDSKPVNFNCPKCGTTIRANAAFCPNCGRKIIR